MAVSIATGTQLRKSSPEMTGTATAFSEAVTSAAGPTALDLNVPVSIVTMTGTATTVTHAVSLATTAPYEGFEKWVITEQTATDSVGILSIELGGARGDPAAQNVKLEYPGCAKFVWINGAWHGFGTLTQGAAASVTTAT